MLGHGEFFIFRSEGFFFFFISLTFLTSITVLTSDDSVFLSHFFFFLSEIKLKRGPVSVHFKKTFLLWPDSMLLSSMITNFRFLFVRLWKTLDEIK